MESRGRTEGAVKACRKKGMQHARYPYTPTLAVPCFIVGAAFTAYVMRIWELGDAVMF